MIDPAFIPDPYDILITDVSHRDIVERIPNALRIRYMSRVEQDDPANYRVAPMNGVIWGSGRRVFVHARIYAHVLDENLGRSVRGPEYNIHMLVDTGSPRTFLTSEVLNMLGLIASDNQTVYINGRMHQCDMSKLHYEDINILGMDFVAEKADGISINSHTKACRIDVRTE